MNSNMKWKCRRCGEIVDYEKFKCGCTESPSPWEPIIEDNNIVELLREIKDWMMDNDYECGEQGSEIYSKITSVLNGLENNNFYE